MAAKFYAVLDTNVLVSALYTGNTSSNPRQILDLTLGGVITPLLNLEISAEYFEVLSRDKFKFKPEDVDALLEALGRMGIDPGRTSSQSCGFSGFQRYCLL